MTGSETNFFQAARKKAGLTQFAAALKLGVMPSTVGNWENGQTPRLSYADKIAQVYGVPIPKVLEAMRGMAVAARESE